MRRRDLLRWGVKLAGLTWLGCRLDDEWLLPATNSDERHASDDTLLARIAHITDTHIVDEESPARFPAARVVTQAAWRPHESYAPHLLDGALRVVNRIHASGRTIHAVIHSGDACDNAQINEWQWVLDLFGGGEINPRSGPDDRPWRLRPPIHEDPHAPFVAEGLYRQGVHGPAASIPCYFAPGNHDVHALGVFPTFADGDGHRTAPLPLPDRPGLVLPTALDPLAAEAYGRVTPADPGPPVLFEQPRPVVANAGRRFITPTEFAQHGQDVARLTAPIAAPVVGPDGAYRVTLTDHVRAILLNSTAATPLVPGGFHVEGALTRAQLDFLAAELDAAVMSGNCPIVVTHHPSTALLPLAGSQVRTEELHATMQRRAAPIVHLAGHRHRHHVVQRTGYIEIETAALIDPPQELRIVEFWRDDRTGTISVRYETLSHLDATYPSIGDDPARTLRETAAALAKNAPSARPRATHSTPAWGHSADQAGVWVFPA